VHHELAKDGNKRVGLDAITDTAKAVDQLDIFTLNHDVLIEAQCRSANVLYEDGFADRRGELLVFSWWPQNKREKVRLFKLHGSVNWFLYAFPVISLCLNPLRVSAIKNTFRHDL
jgi:hypothetical protein